MFGRYPITQLQLFSTSITCTEHLCVSENTHGFLSSESLTELVCNGAISVNIVNGKMWRKG